MKYLILILTFVFASNTTFGQNSYDLKPGDVLVINTKTNMPFDHIYFPKPNFIIKRGAIANYKALNGIKVQIDEISDNSIMRLKPLNGKKFFNTYSYVEAHLEKAIENDELKFLNIHQNTVALVQESK
eukprot:m.471353 g.471353  ORF g.471353 m.471353 type:complete len:128 (+) comp30913_c0_seq1:101-484(+)